MPSLTLGQQQVLHGLDCGIDPHRFLIQASISLGETINPERLAEAFQALFGQHPELLSGFSKTPETGWKAISTEETPVPIREIDWSSHVPTEVGPLWQALQKEETNRAIDLTQPPLFRLALITLPDASTHFLWTFHESILSPAQAFEYFCELLLYYDGLTPALPSNAAAPPTETRDSTWFHKQFEFGGTVAERIPAIHRTSLTEGSGIGMIQRRLDDALARRIFAAAESRKVAPATLLSGAWAFALSRWNATDRIAFSRILPAADACRFRVPVRIFVDQEAGVGEWLELLPSEEELLALTPEDLAEEMTNTVWPTAIEVTDGPLDPDIGRDLPRWMRADFKFQALPVGEFLLQFSLRDDPPRAELRLSYDTAQTSERDAERVFHGFLQAIDSLLDDPSRRLAELEILPKAEVQAILESANALVEPPEPERLEEVVATFAGQHPDQTAVSMGEESLTYGELQQYAGELAAHLQGELTKEKPRVGICLTVTPWLPVAILGALRAASGVALLDPKWPQPLINALLEETHCACLLCDSESATLFPEEAGPKRLVIDAEWETISSLPRERSTEIPTSEEAFQIFNAPESLEASRTVFRHPAILDAARFHATGLREGYEQRLLLSEPAHTVPGLETLFAALANGYRIVLSDPETLENPSTLQRLLHDEEISALFCRQEAWRALNDYLRRARLSLPGRIERLTLWRSGTEPMAMRDFAVLRNASVELSVVWRSETASATGLAAAFGHSSLDRAREEFGAPLPHSGALLLDPQDRLVPLNAPGEIALTGTCLAEAFDPTAKDAPAIQSLQLAGHEIRAIRTGLFATRAPDGTLVSPAPPADSEPEFSVTDTDLPSPDPENLAAPPHLPPEPSDPQQPGLFETDEPEDFIVRLTESDSPKNLLFVIPPGCKAEELGDLAGQLREKANCFAIELARLPMAAGPKTLGGLASNLSKSLDGSGLRFDQLLGLGRAGYVILALSRRPARLASAVFSLLDAPPPPGKGMWARFQTALEKMQAPPPSTASLTSIDDLLQNARAEPTDAPVQIFVRSEGHSMHWKPSAPQARFYALPTGFPGLLHNEYASATSQVLIDKLKL